MSRALDVLLRKQISFGDRTFRALVITLVWFGLFGLAYLIGNHTGSDRAIQTAVIILGLVATVTLADGAFGGVEDVFIALFVVALSLAIAYLIREAPLGWRLTLGLSLAAILVVHSVLYGGLLPAQREGARRSSSGSVAA